MMRLLPVLACLWIFQAVNSPTLQAEVKATPHIAEVNAGMGKESAQIASRTESSAVNFAGTFTFAGEPKPTGYPNRGTRLANTAFLVAYDEMRENPAWAA